MSEEGGKDPMGLDRWFRAVSWHATLREANEKELTNSVGGDWKDWYADAQNRRVFDDVSRLLADSARYSKRRRCGRGDLEGDSYDLSVPIAEWRRTQALQRTRKERTSGRNWWSLSAGIGATAVALLIALWSRPFGFSGDTGHVVYQTEVGGLKDVQLSDGSSIILGGRTQLSVAMSVQRRSIRIIGGQAWFKVAHDPRRPFVVVAGNGTITDIGTAFLVTRDSDRVVVTVTEGAVEVNAPQPTQPSLALGRGLGLRAALTPIRVSRGEQLAFSDTGTLSPLKLADTRAATAWTQGRLTFDNQPLRYVVEAVNRYSSRHIIVSPSACMLRFSGIVFDDDIADWLQSLNVIFPVIVEEQGADVRIEMQYSNPATGELSSKKQL